MTFTIKVVELEATPNQYLYAKVKPSKWACMVKGHIWRLLDAGNFRMCDRCRQHQLRVALGTGRNQWRNV